MPLEETRTYDEIKNDMRADAQDDPFLAGAASATPDSPLHGVQPPAKEPAPKTPPTTLESLVSKIHSALEGIALGPVRDDLEKKLVEVEALYASEAAASSPEKE